MRTIQMSVAEYQQDLAEAEKKGEDMMIKLFNEVFWQRDTVCDHEKAWQILTDRFGCNEGDRLADKFNLKTYEEKK